MLVNNIEKQKSEAIVQASTLAMEKLDREVSAYMGNSLHQLMINTLIKIILVASSFIAYEMGWITSNQFGILAATLLALFLMRDLMRIWPTFTILGKTLHKHGWRPKQAFTRYVATTVFDEALKEVTQETSKPKTRLLLTLAGTSPQEVSLEIAQAVAEISQKLSLQQVRPHIIVAAIKAGTILTLYSGIVFLIFALV